MKKIVVVFCFALLMPIFSIAQGGWISHSNSTPYFSFLLPDTAQVFDTLHVKYFALKIDSTVALQVHLMDSAYIDSNNDYFDDALEQTDGDTLRAIAKLMVFSTGSELTEVSSININGKVGLQIGLRYEEAVAPDELHSFIRFFKFGKYFISFTITGLEYDIDNLLTIKNSFFNSISFAAP